MPHRFREVNLPNLPELSQLLQPLTIAHQNLRQMLPQQQQQMFPQQQQQMLPQQQMQQQQQQQQSMMIPSDSSNMQQTEETNTQQMNPMSSNQNEATMRMNRDLAPQSFADNSQFVSMANPMYEFMPYERQQQFYDPNYYYYQ